MAKEKTAVKEAEAKFTRSQLLSSARYRNRVDLVGVLTSEGKEYTLADVDKLIADYYEKEV